VDATIFALKKQSEPVVLLLGGRDKGLAFTDLLATARGRVKAVVAFGEARDKIAREIGDSLPIHKTETLAEAIERARKLAAPGEVVLFSPACASYDQFKNYEERGEAFRKMVNELHA
jgi:UDP-N-acetylmuramoylalanine--D-glutamate ligase